MQSRRIAFQLLLIGSQLSFPVNRAGYPGTSLVDQHGQVADARDVDCTVKESRIPLRTDQRQVAAEAPADNADPTALRDSLLNGPLRAVHHVVIRESAPVLVSREKPVVAVPVRPAKIHLQYGVPPA